MALSRLGRSKLNSLGKWKVYIRFKQVLMSVESWELERVLLQQKHTNYCGKFGCYLQHSRYFCEMCGYHTLIFLVKGFYQHHYQAWCLGILSKSILKKGCEIPPNPTLFIFLFCRAPSCSKFKGNFSVIWVDFLWGDWKNKAEGGGDPELPCVCTPSNFRFWSQPILVNPLFCLSSHFRVRITEWMYWSDASWK